MLNRMHRVALIALALLLTSLLALPSAQAVEPEDFQRFNLESYWYSRYILSRAHARSGMGVHMLWGPLFQGEMSQLQSTVQTFSEETGHAIPTNPWPVFLEFTSAEPYFTQEPIQEDFATLRWDQSTFDRTIETGALGQAAVKKTVWIEQFLRAIYDPPENRFIGFVLTGETLSTFNWLRTQGTNTGEPLDPANYQGEYFPHAFELEFEQATTEDGNPLPPQPVGVTITDPDSVLSDQYALLWATTEFKSLTENEQTAQFYDGEPFPAEVGQLTTGLSMAIFQNIQQRHWNADAGTLVDRNANGESMESTATTATTARAVTGLANFYKAFVDAPPAQQAHGLIADQADFLVNLQRDDGSFPNSYDTAAGEADDGATTLETQAAAINALLIARDVTGNESYEAAAFEGFAWMLDNLWDDENGVYSNTADASTYTYTPWQIGSVLASHRNLFLKGDDLAGHRLVEFWDNVVNSSGMIQAELPQTGEVIGDGEADTDGDGIPEPGLNATEAAPNGIDAVLAGEVQFDPSSGEWSITDRTYHTEPQMYAANEMYITGIPTFAPDMVQALELRSITPETKVSLASLEEAQGIHDSIMSEQVGAAADAADDGEAQQTEDDEQAPETLPETGATDFVHRQLGLGVVGVIAGGVVLLVLGAGMRKWLRA